MYTATSVVIPDPPEPETTLPRMTCQYVRPTPLMTPVRLDLVWGNRGAYTSALMFVSSARQAHSR